MSGEPHRQIVTVFRSRLREGYEPEYADMAARMVEVARSVAGFVDIKSFVAEDGERVSIVIFDSIEAHRAWRDHPQHRRAQRAGRERFYSEYHIAVCEQMAERAFTA